jgi:hypothetical protein
MQQCMVSAAECLRHKQAEAMHTVKQICYVTSCVLQLIPDALQQTSSLFSLMGAAAHQSRLQQNQFAQHLHLQADVSVSASMAECK